MKKRTLLLITSLLFASSCNQQNSSKESNVQPPLTSIDILKDTYSVNELNVLVGDTFKLEVNSSINSNDLKWESSNQNIIKIDDKGNVEVLEKGTAIITVTLKDFAYITDSIYVIATRKVEQLGVGSGKSKEDPIFKGNEGEDEPIEVYFIEMQHIYADSIFIKKVN